MFTVISVFPLCHLKAELASMPDAARLEVHPAQSLWLKSIIEPESELTTARSPNPLMNSQKNEHHFFYLRILKTCV